MILINEKQTAQMSIKDRAFHYGDGCFTTLLVRSGKPCYWDAHLARLQRDTNQLGITDIDWQQLERQLELLLNEVAPLSHAVIKIMITRGEGGRGYSPEGCHSPNVILSTHDYPAHYLRWQQQGIVLTRLAQPLGLSPLAGIKHLNRLEQVMAKRELSRHQADEGVMCCLQGNVIETTAGNIFWRKGATLYTPTLNFAGVRGVQREQVLLAAAKLRMAVHEVTALPAALDSADEIFVCNALMELVPVRQFERREFRDFSCCKTLMLRSD